jgi:hypothetical protein
VSNALAIASVSAVLTDLLRNGIIDADLPGHVGDVVVSTMPPDRVPAPSGAEETRLNLFLYQLTPNAAWRNIGMPARNSRGERVGDPPLALDLHYLLTAYGAQDYFAEILLGYAMQLLHETPVLGRDDVRTALTSSLTGTGTGLPPNLTNLANSGLADQVELIKLTPESLTTEEISRLWAAFQTSYRPTAAYCASVVLIETGKPTTAPLPVKAFTVKARTLQLPLIESIAASTGPGRPIHADSTIVISGRNLQGDETRLRIGGAWITPPATQVTPTAITLDLGTLSGLRAGVLTVRVVHRELLGPSPQKPHVGFESNVMPFVLQPALTVGAVAMGAGSHAGLRSGTVTLTVAPDVYPGQRLTILLNELLPLPIPDDAVARSYAIPVPPVSAQTPTVVVGLTDIEVGTYLVRIEVDGAQSPLSPDTGRWSSPTVVIA